MKKISLIAFLFPALIMSAQKETTDKTKKTPTHRTSTEITLNDSLKVISYMNDSTSTPNHVIEYSRGGLFRGLDIGFYEDNGRICFATNRNKEGRLERVYFFDKKGRLVCVQLYENGQFIKRYKTFFWDDMPVEDRIQMQKNLSKY